MNLFENIKNNLNENTNPENIHTLDTQLDMLAEHLNYIRGQYKDITELLTLNYEGKTLAQRLKLVKIIVDSYTNQNGLKENNIEEIELPKYDLNPLDEEGNTVQIYGQVNGMAWKIPGEDVPVYQLEFKFFTSDKVLHKVTTSEKDMTMRRLESVKERIDKTIRQEEERIKKEK